MSRTRTPLQCRRGQALIVAILALTVLTAAAIALSATARLELRAARRGMDAVQRDAALRGGVNRGLALLEQGRGDTRTLLSTLREHRELRWTSFTPGSDPDQPPAQVAVQLLDASARLSLNSVDANQLQKLGVGRDAAQAILSWRNEKSKDDYSKEARPYDPKRRPFDTLEELLLVRGVQPGLFFGPPDPAAAAAAKEPPLTELLSVFSGENNADASGEARANVNSADSSDLLAAANRNGKVVTQEQALKLVTSRDTRALTGAMDGQSQGRAYSSVTDALKEAGVEQKHWGPVLDAWTADKRSFLPGKVNINTAPAAVLYALPNIEPAVARKILEMRRKKPAGLDWSDVMQLANNDGLGTTQPGGDQAPGQTPQQQQPAPSTNTGGFQPNLTLDQLEKLFCTRSSVYLVRCLVREAGSARTDAAQAVVYWPASLDEPAKIVQWRQPDRYPGWSAWHRPVGEEEGVGRDR